MPLIFQVIVTTVTVRANKNIGGSSLLTPAIVCLYSSFQVENFLDMRNFSNYPHCDKGQGKDDQI